MRGDRWWRITRAQRSLSKRPAPAMVVEAGPFLIGVSFVADSSEYASFAAARNVSS
jgi:hypothetical protein